MRIPVAMLIGSLSCLAIDAQAGEWQQVLGGYDLKVYSDTVRSSTDADGSKIVEFLATWDTPKSIPHQGGGAVKSVKVQATIFCKRGSHGTYGLRGAGFSEQGMQGETLFADKPLGYQNIEAGTLWYELSAKYCPSWWKKMVPNRLINLFD